MHIIEKVTTREWNHLVLTLMESPWVPSRTSVDLFYFIYIREEGGGVFCFLGFFLVFGFIVLRFPIPSPYGVHLGAAYIHNKSYLIRTSLKKRKEKKSSANLS